MPALRDEVERLLRAHAVSWQLRGRPRLLDDHPGRAASSRTSPARSIGPYKLLQQIGEGGMGVVYMAEQTHPLRRKVALKIIKPGMDSRQVIARFEAERQALAMMDHPNIAKVLDAGATATGRPYFVMELVTGVPITEYCDQAQLTPRERLALLVPVCQAIQHAHQKGIIHRDIKPSNVLVSLYDGGPVPKVIDFGVAKAIEQRLTERTLFTQHGAIVGTLEYMSPEQAENSALDIDTRTDVYALGVLLYELLTGTTPLERHRLQAGRICGDPPPDPRGGVAEAEHAALEDRAARRDRRAARHGAGEAGPAGPRRARLDRDEGAGEGPQPALRDGQRPGPRPPAIPGRRAVGGRAALGASTGCGKFARKHRAALVTAGAFAAVLVAATAVSIWQAIRATRESGASVGGRGRQSCEFFRDRMLAATRPVGRARLGASKYAPRGHRCGRAEHRLRLRRPADSRGRHPRQPWARRTCTWASRGWRSAQHERAMQLRARELGPDHPETLTSMNNLAVAYQAAGRIADAIPLHKRAFAIFKAKLGRSHADTLGTMNNLATDYQLAGRLPEAIAIFEEGLALRKATLGPDHTDTLNSTNYLGVAYYTAGRIAEALSLLEQALKGLRATLGPDHLDTLTAMNNLASTYLEVGQLNDAVLLLEETLNRRKVQQGPDHLDTLNTMNNLAAAYQISGRTGDAVPLFEKVLALRTIKLEHDHPDKLKSLHNLATSYREAGRTDEAIPLFEQAVTLRKAKLKPDHSDTLASMNSLGAAYLDVRQWAKAESVLRDCLKLREQTQPDDWRRFHTMSQLGASLAALEKYADAEPMLIDGYEGLKAREAKIPPRFKKELSAAASRIVPFYEKWGNPKVAGTWRLKLGSAKK